MELTERQVEQFQRDGFLIFPALFSPEEVERLREEAERVAGLDAECVFREGSSGLPKTMFRLHAQDGPTASPAYHAAAHAPRILRPARQALGTDEVYIHHCKVNMKAAIEGSAWPWHQDFGTWHLDGIEEPSMATFLVMLDEATEMNGCLYFLPGSHRDGRVDPYLDNSTAYSLWASKPETMKAAMNALPEPVAVTGPPGTAALFHCNLLHASGHNLSATDRWHTYFCFNACANRPRDVENPRPDYVRSTDWRPMVEGADAIL